MPRASAQDVDRIAGSLPGAELGISWGDRPTWKVAGKGFLVYRAPHRTAVDPTTGEPFEDLLVVITPDHEAKAVLVQGDGPFFDIDHFRGHTGVLVRLSRLGEISRAELTEIITEAWAHRAPRAAVRAHLGEEPDPLEGLGAPARRALQNAGLTTRSALDAASDADLLALHGFGPKGLRIVRGR
ncbi:MmcQ/YjbR family DNA-binding protein [Agilicoccus flavus]|uniref:MmcQ/YjbR family DNA-binding protein n=1 Tax=Agilicoccus flavus TaxID=2775968 RepID=UPI001CF6E363|nr:MmcQ/YjbR family DNA-binding protein [Agilicoccus flavus]